MILPGHRSDLPPRSEAEQLGFFRRVLALAETAEARGDVVVRHVEIAGMVIRFVFAGAELERLLFPALAHREVVAPAEPELVLHIWDSASTGVAMCPPPVEQHCFSDRGDIWSFQSQRIRSAFHWSEYSLNLLDLERGEGVFWVRSTVGLPYWTQASPFRTLLHWWARRRGAQLIHAAAVGSEAGGVLITGRGGVGKSTTALACLAQGFAYAGDDYVLLTAGDTVSAHSLYRTAKVNAGDTHRFARFNPGLLGGASIEGGEKAVMYLDQVAHELPLRAVVTPFFGEAANTRFEPIDPAQLTGAASYTTIAQLPHAGPDTMDFIEAQLQQLPAFRMVLGTDPDRAPKAIDRLLAGPERLPASSKRSPARPLVSVIVPVFNAAHMLPAAIASLLAQNYPKLEIIVVDDGSTDALTEAVASLSVEVRFLRQANGGPAAARNLGIRAASGDLLAFLDADDMWVSHKLDVQVAWFEEHPEADVVIGRAQLMAQSEDGAFQAVGSPAESFTSYIGAALYRRRAFQRNGLFDPLLRFGEDTDWFANARHTDTRVDRIDAITLLVRRHAQNSTRDLTGIELNPIRLIKNALDRKRGRSG
jgi:hypothetical protein